MVTVDILDETERLSTNELELVADLVAFVAKQEKVACDSEVSLTIVDNEAIRLINKEYRNKDEATDVISFALNDDESDLKLEQVPILLGDIIVSYDKMIEQAKEYGHSTNRELGFLVVHGFLHLLGYDHIDEEDEKVMVKRQEDLLTAYGLEK